MRIAASVGRVLMAASATFSIPTSCAWCIRVARINLRLPTLGVLYAWEFEKGGRAVNVLQTLDIRPMRSLAQRA